MNLDRWAQIEELFHRAVDSDPAFRAELLDEACRDHSELRREVEALLAFDCEASQDMQAAIHTELRSLVYPLAGKTVSHYRIVGGVGCGGMGTVYRAQDVKLPRRVAIKFLPEESATDPNALRRFEREANSASALEHPNICPIYEFGEHEGQPFIVMPLLEGDTVEQQICSEGLERRPLQVPKLLDLAIQVLKGLEAAHSHRIIHRDIKPGNIFITDDGQARLLDFGVAKLTFGDIEADGNFRAQAEADTATVASSGDLTLSGTGMAAGTAAYMSPEQVRGEKVDARTDLFSFGLVLYEMATGKRAFTGSTWPTLREAILSQMPEPARGVNPELPTKLEEIIKKALEKNREVRYQTASEMRADLEDLQSQLAPKQRPFRWAVAAGVIFVLLVTATVFLLKRPPKVISVAPEIKLRQLTTNAVENRVITGAISPDGRYLAYTDLKGAHVKLLATGETHTVAEPVVLKDGKVLWEFAAWLPDSSRFLANTHPSADEPGQFSSADSTIWMVSVQGGTPGKIRERAIAYSVSPDNTWIAFGANGSSSGEHEIWLMDLNGRRQQKFLEKTGEGNSICCLMWSSDSQSQAYITNDQSGDKLVSRDAKSGTIKTLLSPLEMAKFNDFSLLPNGRVVYAVRDVESVGTDTCNYWTMQLDLRTATIIDEPRRLTNWTGFCMYGAVATADGKHLTFLQWASHGSVYVADLRARGARLINSRHFTLDESFNFPQDWTNDSKSLIFTSNRDGRFGIYKQSLDEESPQAISIGKESFRDTRVTPDGKWLFGILWPKLGGPSDPDRVMRIPLSGGAAEFVTAALAHPMSAVLCARPPSKLCVLGERSDDRKQLIFTSIDPLKSRGVELARFNLDPSEEFSTFDVSPDGTRLAVSGSTHGPIHILPLRGQPEQVLPAKFNHMNIFLWAANGKALYVADDEKEGSVLSYLDLHGGSHVLWRNRGSNSALVGVPSPDGQHLAVLGFATSSNIWMMDNF